jgi:hypothetical protein
MAKFKDWEHKNDDEPPPGMMDYEDVATSNMLCESTHPLSRLALLDDPVKHEAAEEVVEIVESPHWIAAENPEGKSVKFFHQYDGQEINLSSDHPEAFLESDLWEDNYPWDERSRQPDDFDGPDLPEKCIFMGPEGKWFDFACEPKVRPKYSGEESGPTIRWDPDDPETEFMRKIYPLCHIPGYQHINYGDKVKKREL